MARVGITFDGVSRGARRAADDTRKSIAEVTREAVKSSAIQRRELEAQAAAYRKLARDTSLSGRERAAAAQLARRSERQLAGEIENTGRRSNRVVSAMRRSIVGLAGDVARLAVRYGSLAAGGLAGSIAFVGFRFNDLKQRSEIAFRTMLGSGERARKMLDDLARFAEKTPFDFPELIRASQRLVAFGFEAEQVIPTLEAVGNAVAGMGGDPETLAQTIRAIGQIQAKGRLMAEEMLQLNEAGSFSWRALAREIGKTVPEAMELARKGMISSDAFLAAFVANSNRRFKGLMDEQSRTFGGSLSNLRDLFSRFSATVTKPLFDEVVRVMQGVIENQEGVERSGERLAGVMRTEVVPRLRSAADWARRNRDEIVAFFKDGVSFGRDLVKVIGQLLSVAKTVANAVGGWDDAFQLVLAGTLARSLGGVLAVLGTAGGTAGIVGAVTRLKTIGLITIPIMIALSDDPVSKWFRERFIDAAVDDVANVNATLPVRGKDGVWRAADGTPLPRAGQEYWEAEFQAGRATGRGTTKQAGTGDARAASDAHERQRARDDTRVGTPSGRTYGGLQTGALALAAFVERTGGTITAGREPGHSPTGGHGVGESLDIAWNEHGPAIWAALFAHKEKFRLLLGPPGLYMWGKQYYNKRDADNHRDHIHVQYQGSASSLAGLLGDAATPVFGSDVDPANAGDLLGGDAAGGAAKTPPLIPARLRLGIAQAELTKTLRDDLAALDAVQDYLEQRISKTKDIERRIDLLNELRGVRDARADILEQLGGDLDRDEQQRGRYGIGFVSRRVAQLEPQLRRGFHSRARQLRAALEDATSASELGKITDRIKKFNQDFVKAIALTGAIKQTRADAREIADTLGRMPAAVRADLEPKLAAVRAQLGKITTKAQLDKVTDDMERIRDALNEALDQMRADVERRADFVSDAFGRVGDKLGEVFEARVEEMLQNARARVAEFGFEIGAGEETPAERALRERLEAKRAGDVARRRSEIEAELQRLRGQLGGSGYMQFDVSQGRVVARPAGGAAAEDAATRQQRILDLEQQLNDLLFDEQTEALEKQARLERQAADAALERERQRIRDEQRLVRERFDMRLAEIRRAFQEEEISAEQAQQRILDLMGEYQLDFETAGRLIGAAFAQGFRDSMTLVADAVRELRDAINQLGYATGETSGRTTGDPIYDLSQRIDAAARLQAGRIQRAGFPGFDGGGRVPGMYVGRPDTLVARLTPGERVLDRDFNRRLEQALFGAGVPGGSPSFVVPITVDGQPIARALVRPVYSELGRLIGYESEVY